MNRFRAQWAQLMNRLAFYRDRGNEAWSRMSERDRKLATGLAVGGAIVFCVVSFYLATGHVTRLKADIATRAKQLEDVRAMRTDFRASKDRLDQINQKLKASSAPAKSFLEEKARESRIEIASMTDRAAPPNELFKAAIVEVKMKKVTLANLTRFLHKIESASAGYSVQSIELTPNYQDNKYLDGQIHVLSLKPKES